MMVVPDLFYALLVAQAVDIVLGLLWAWLQKRIHSGVAQRGMTRKVAILILAGFVTTQERFLTPVVGINVSALCLTYFLVAETISILRYAVLLGVPVPRGLRERLEEVQAELDRVNRNRTDRGNGDDKSRGGHLLAFTLVDWGIRIPPLWWLILRGVRGGSSWRV